MISSLLSTTDLYLLYEHSPLAVVTLSVDLKMVSFNPAWERLVREYAGISPTPNDNIATIFAGTALHKHLLQANYPSPINLTLNHKEQPHYWQITTISAANRLHCLVHDISPFQRTRQQLEKNLADRTKKLNVLYDVMSATSDAPDLRTTLTWSLARILEAIKCDAGAIQIINDFGDDTDVESLRLIAQQGLPQHVADELASLPLETGLAGWIMRHDEPLISKNVASNPHTTEAVKNDPSLQSFVGVTMQVYDRVVGVLSVFSQRERRFTEVEVALLNSVADQIGIVIENAYLHKQAAELAIAEERNRLARELHDSVTQSIYSLTLFAEAGMRLVKSKNYQLITECLQQLSDTSQKALREMRLLLHELRPTDLEEEGLVGAIQQRLEAVEARANIEAQLIVEGDLNNLPDSVEEQLYRIAQEALNNALKHSSATLLKVHIRADEASIALEISDDGAGFDPNKLGDGGLGLKIMEERAEDLEGDLEVVSALGEGTTVTVTIDLEEFETAQENEIF